MRPRRDVFALDYLVETIEYYEFAVRHRDEAGAAVDPGELAWAHNVLADYFSIVDRSNPVVAGAFAQTVLASGGPQPQIVVTDREPVGDQRKDADAIVRVAVPAWGVVRVQDGKPPLVAAFADVRAELVLRETGVVLWKHDEDVTHPERLPEGALGGDRAAARERLTEVLERAGRRMGNELVYAMGRR